jgi:hypothetical protein
MLVAVLVPALPTSQAQSDYSLRGNPDFSADNLSPEMRLWYDRLWAAIGNSAIYPNPGEAAASGDLYQIGRTLNVNITALLTAFRITGAPALLGEVDRLMEIARGQLQDYNDDDYLNWRWLRETTSSYYGDDRHPMDEMLAHSYLPEVAYALRLNVDLNPDYAAHADFWEDYIVNQFLKKWQERGGLDRSLTHPYTHFMRMYYYLSLLTGDQSYLAEAERRGDVLNSMMREIDSRYGVGYIWDHRVPDMGDTPLGCQPTVYALLTVTAFQDLALEGYGRYADPGYMEHYAVTFRDFVLQYGTDQLAGDICGEGDEGFEKFLLSGLSGLAAWDDTGLIQNLAVEAYTDNENADHPQRIFIPAYMLQVIALQSGQ